MVFVVCSAFRSVSVSRSILRSSPAGDVMLGMIMAAQCGAGKDSIPGGPGLDCFVLWTRVREGLLISSDGPERDWEISWAFLCGVR